MHLSPKKSAPPKLGGGVLSREADFVPRVGSIPAQQYSSWVIIVQVAKDVVDLMDHFSSLYRC